MIGVESRTVTILMVSSILALVVTAGVAWTMNVEADAPFDEQYEFGPFVVEEGQTMEVDLGQQVLRHSGEMAENRDVSVTVDASALPAWITVSDGSVMTIAPTAPAYVHCTVEADVVYTVGQSSHSGIHTISFDVSAVPSDSVHDSTIVFDPAGGLADYTSITCGDGDVVALPGCDAPGKVFLGWYADGQRVGTAGDYVSPSDGQVITAQYEDDPDYVAPGTYDWTISLAIAAGLLCLFFVAWRYGGQGN